MDISSVYNLIKGFFLAMLVEMRNKNKKPVISSKAKNPLLFYSFPPP